MPPRGPIGPVGGHFDGPAPGGLGPASGRFDSPNLGGPTVLSLGDPEFAGPRGRSFGHAHAPAMDKGEGSHTHGPTVVVHSSNVDGPKGGPFGDIPGMDKGAGGHSHGSTVVVHSSNVDGPKGGLFDDIPIVDVGAGRHIHGEAGSHTHGPTVIVHSSNVDGPAGIPIDKTQPVSTGSHTHGPVVEVPPPIVREPTGSLSGEPRIEPPTVISLGSRRQPVVSSADGQRRGPIDTPPSSSNSVGKF